MKFCLTDLTINDIRCQHFTDIILIITALYSKFLLFKLVEEMATSAGLQCELDPVLCEALRVHRGEVFFVNALLTDKSCVVVYTCSVTVRYILLYSQ